MHELPVTQAIVEQAAAEAARQGWGDRVREVYLRVGNLTTFVPQSLIFYFDILKQDTCLKNAALRVEVLAVRGRCQDCGAQTTFEDLPFVCAACGSPNIGITSGRELEITSFTVDDGETAYGDQGC